MDDNKKKYNCAQCLKPATFQCAACKSETLRYCSKACQKQNWPVHKSSCKGRVNVGKQPSFINLDKILLLGEMWVNHMSEVRFAPMEVQRIVRMNNTLYMYCNMDNIDDSGPWMEKLEEQIGAEEFKRLKFGNTCDTVTLAIGSSLERYVAAKRLVTGIDAVQVTKVEILDLRLKAEYLRPVVLCYADPATPLSDVREQDKDVYGLHNHRVLCLTLKDERRIMLDFSRQQYAFGDIDVSVSYDTYMSRYVHSVTRTVTPQTVLEQMKVDEKTADELDSIMKDMANDAFIVIAGDIRTVVMQRKTQEDFRRTMETAQHALEVVEGLFDRFFTAPYRTITYDALKEDCARYPWW